MNIRQASATDLPGLLDLYTHLHDNPLPEIDARIEGIWRTIMDDPNHRILVMEHDDVLISSCVLILVPNLTNLQRPYALVENVVTRREFRGKGIATQLLDRAKDIAIAENCYKISLMTGSKEERVMGFYENAGYNRKDKTAFIIWLNNGAI